MSIARSALTNGSRPRKDALSAMNNFSDNISPISNQYSSISAEFSPSTGKNKDINRRETCIAIVSSS